MKLEVGKWYVTRSGESAHKVTQHRPANDIYPFRGSGMNCWRENGRVGVSEKAIFNDDLVREIPDPTQPSQAQSKDAEDAQVLDWLLRHPLAHLVDPIGREAFCNTIRAAIAAEEKANG